jgi:hypothetical protein
VEALAPVLERDLDEPGVGARRSLEGRLTLALVGDRDRQRLRFALAAPVVIVVAAGSEAKRAKGEQQGEDAAESLLHWISLDRMDEGPLRVRAAI